MLHVPTIPLIVSVYLIKKVLLEILGLMVTYKGLKTQGPLSWFNKGPDNDAFPKHQKLFDNCTSLIQGNFHPCRTAIAITNGKNT